MRKGVVLFWGFVLLCSTGLYAQMPPHPDVLKKIQRGAIELPYAIRNRAAITAAGIDHPWIAPDLEQMNKAANVPALRTHGALASPSGSWRALVIMVQFTDKPQQTPAAYFDSMIFGTSTGTLRDYYKTVSYGALDVVTVNLPGILGWQMAPQTYSYYCNNQNGMGAYPNNSQKLTEDLVNAVDGSIDFSQYDNDHDGYVDALFIIHAGSGAERTGSNRDIWSHAWTTNSPILKDGVRVFRYSIEPEYWDSPGDMTIGVFAHELGHAAFGLPDLYDRDYSSAGLGNWSLMSGGTWNGLNGDSPAFPDAYCRIQMGFAWPTIITQNILSRDIPDVETNPVILKIWKNGTPDKEYFLVENRAKIFSDQSLVDAGLLIYHVDESVTTQNDLEWYPGKPLTQHYLVALEQADGLYHLEKSLNQGDQADPFPGFSSNCNFANTTSPDSKMYTRSATGVGVKNILKVTSTSTLHRADLEVIATDTTLRIVSPNGGERWPVGYTKQIILDALNTGPLTVEYTIDNGSTWMPIATVDPMAPFSPMHEIDAVQDVAHEFSERAGTITGGIIDWIVPHSPSGQCKVRATMVNAPARSVESANTFTIVSVPEGQFTVLFNYDVSAVNGKADNVGAIFIPSLNEFWTSCFTSNLLHRWRPNGTMIEEFSIQGVSTVRAMTYDGRYVYTGSNTNTISIIDPITKALVGTIAAPIAVRFVTYDPTADQNAGGFWFGNYDTDLFLINRSGTVLRTLPYSALESKANYGAAYDPFSPGGPYIWLSSQLPDQMVRQISLATGQPTGLEHDLMNDVGSMTGGGSSGGLFISEGIVPGKAVIGGIFQGDVDHLYGYQLIDRVPNITLILPNGGEHFRKGRIVPITWTSGLVANVKIEYTADNGAHWIEIVPTVAATLARYDWTVPAVTSTQCRIRISDAANSAVSDQSDSLFAITEFIPTTETEPNNTTETANAIEYGDSLDAVISSVDDVDYYRFTATVGDTIEIIGRDRNESALEGVWWLSSSQGSSFLGKYFYPQQPGGKRLCVPGGGAYYLRCAAIQNYGSVPNSISTTIGNREYANLIPENRSLSAFLTSDNGEYRIRVQRFAPMLPELTSFGIFTMDCMSMRLAIGFNSNGLNTTIKMDYGTTPSYGRSVMVTPSPIKSLDESLLPYDLGGLQPSTTYHFRLTLTNSLGTVISRDFSLTTVAAPDGFILWKYATYVDFYSVSFTDALNGTAVGSGVILRTTNGGRTWVEQHPPDFTAFYAVAFTDAQTGTIVGGNGTILRTTDGGSTWTQQTSGRQYALYGICFTNANTATVVGYDAILSTSNGGATWTRQTSPVAGKNLWGVSFSDAMRGTIVGDDGTILRTTNGGSTWVKQTSGTTNTLFAVSFYDANNGTAVGDGIVLRTRNGGATWTQQTIPQQMLLRSIAFADSMTGTIVGNNGSILQTTNGGATWVQKSSGTLANLMGVCIKEGVTSIAGYSGTILRSAADSSTTITLDLDPSWNLVSWNVDTPIDSTTVLLAAIKDAVKVVMGFNNGAQTYDPLLPPGINTLKIMDHCHGYWFKINTAAGLTLSGTNPERTTPIPVAAGWNLVGYVPTQSDSLIHALASLSPNIGIVMGYEAGGLTYCPTIPARFNTLKLLKPGYGYWIKSSAADTLIYPNASVAPASSPQGDKESPSITQPPLTGVRKTREWIGLYADRFLINSVPIGAGTIITAVTNNGVVCGACVVETPGEFGMMAVYADDPSTEMVEGARAGEALYLQLNSARYPTGIAWMQMGDVFNVSKNVTSADVVHTTFPAEYALSQNYPNPFNPLTRIDFAIPSVSHVSLKIYDMLGREVAVLAEGERQPGYFSVEWNASRVGSGIYVCRLTAGPFTRSFKMCVLK